MSAESVAGWKPTPHARRARSRGVLRRLPKSERIAAREERKRPVVTRVAKPAARPRFTFVCFDPTRAERKATAAARKAARRAYADALKTHARAVRRNRLALERSIAVM